MNIAFFLRPKALVSYLEDEMPVNEAIQTMVKAGYTAIPVINKTGHYLGTISEGDFLRLLLEKDKAEIDKMRVSDVPRKLKLQTVNTTSKMNDMIDLMAEQNFIPVADGRGIFIGIITRQDVMKYMRENIKE